MKTKMGAVLFFLFIQMANAWAKEVLLDVRTPEEYGQSYLPGAINIDVLNKDFRNRISTLNRDDSYKVYCRSGKRAAQAVTIMGEMGFQNLTNLGGFEDAQKTLKLKPISKQ